MLGRCLTKVISRAIAPSPPPPPIKLVAGETESEAAEFWWRQRNDDDVASVDKDDWVEWFTDDYSMGQLCWWWIQARVKNWSNLMMMMTIDDDSVDDDDDNDDDSCEYKLAQC